MCHSVPRAELGSIFIVPPNLDKIDVDGWIEEFGLPLSYEYNHPSKQDRVCMPPPGYIAVFRYSLQ